MVDAEVWWWMKSSRRERRREVYIESSRLRCFRGRKNQAVGLWWGWRASIGKITKEDGERWRLVASKVEGKQEDMMCEATVLVI